MNTYVVDSNFFIQAHRIIYPLDVAVGFWNQVSDLACTGQIVSIDKVRNEIYQNDDELKQWCLANLPRDFFKDSSELMPEYAAIVSWVMTKRDHYLQAAIDEFLDSDEADAWLVAYGLKNGCTIVTYETSQPGMKRKIKIPEPCHSLNVSYCDTIELFRNLGIQF